MSKVRSTGICEIDNTHEMHLGKVRKYYMRILNVYVEKVKSRKHSGTIAPFILKNPKVID